MMDSDDDGFRTCKMLQLALDGGLPFDGLLAPVIERIELGGPCLRQICHMKKNTPIGVRGECDGIPTRYLSMSTPDVHTRCDQGCDRTAEVPTGLSFIFQSHAGLQVLRMCVWRVSMPHQFSDATYMAVFTKHNPAHFLWLDKNGAGSDLFCTPTGTACLHFPARSFCWAELAALCANFAQTKGPSLRASRAVSSNFLHENLFA